MRTEDIVTDFSTNIFINQHAYVLNANNNALIKDYQGKFKVISLPTGKVVVTGETTKVKKWKDAGESFSTADISGIKKAGEYQIILANGQGSEPFKVSLGTDYSAVSTAAYRTFYLNRSGLEITPEFGGVYARKAGHPDTAVVVHKSASNSSLKPGSIISSPGGWYDAGDYGKYIVNSSISVYTMLMAYEQYPEYHKSLNLNIPESGSSIPDVIEELLYNVRWMLTMQDIDGGLHHKLTTEWFDGFIMPEETSATRYLVMKTTSASLTFAASMASFARVTQGIDGLEEISKQCKEAAIKAWEWSIVNPEVFFQQPEGMITGQYNSLVLDDEWQWAAVELFITTGDEKYLDNVELKAIDLPLSTPTWADVHSLALLSVVWNPESFDTEFYSKAKNALIEQVDELYAVYSTISAKVSLNFFHWGSSCDLANQAIMAFVAHNISGKKDYLEMATNNVDYLLGRNPMRYCFVTGFGTNSPMEIHHRPSAADSIVEPHPGFLIGGPNIQVMGDCQDTLRSDTYPAISYVDASCSYSTNECAINWTSALIYISAAMAELN